ncbi:MAG: response regulator, partial [Nitrosopumilaceae archaeon]
MILILYLWHVLLGGFHNLKLLVIDDNEEITSMLKRYLELEDFEIVISNDGRNGLNLIKNGNFDKILLDLAMPEF